MTARGAGPGHGRLLASGVLAAVCLGWGGPHATGRADDEVPSEPESLAGSAISDTEIGLDWDPPRIALGLSHYIVYRDGVEVGTVAAPKTTYVDVGLQPSTAYQYRVSAVDVLGEGKKSKPVTVKTLAPVDTSPPTAPASLQASAVAPDRIDLAWQPASDPETGVSQYRVYRNGSLLATTSNTSFSDGGVQPQTTYTYDVSAVNGDGLEGPKASASATTPAAPDTSPPSVPGNLQATAITPRQIDLSWQAANDPESGIAVYHVYRDGALLTSTSARAYSDSGLEPETTYGYRVSAVNGEGLEGARTPTVSATTPAAVDTTPPAPPGRPRIIG